MDIQLGGSGIGEGAEHMGNRGNSVIHGCDDGHASGAHTLTHNLMRQRCQQNESDFCELESRAARKRIILM
jgi:hypothetical protein